LLRATPDQWTDTIDIAERRWSEYSLRLAQSIHTVIKKNLCFRLSAQEQDEIEVKAMRRLDAKSRRSTSATRAQLS
jgi:hypothetical protein